MFLALIKNNEGNSYSGRPGISKTGMRSSSLGSGADELFQEEEEGLMHVMRSASSGSILGLHTLLAHKPSVFS